MKNKNGIMLIVGGILIAGGIISWLVFGSKPVIVNIGNGTKVQTSIEMKNTSVIREKDGNKLWEFQVQEVEHDKKKNKAFLHGINGKVFRKDGSWIDIVADKGEVTINKDDKNFSIEGNVKAISNTGGEVYCNKVVYNDNRKSIQAYENVKIRKAEYTAYGDFAETTTAMERFKLKGHAKVEKGGKWDDK